MNSPRQRPFYFTNVVWGEQYRNFFLEYCLPSLLAPGNIPALADVRPAKFLIATTEADWEAMGRTAIFRALERCATPVFLELPPQPPERHYWYQAILGHKLCCELTANDRAIRIFTGPDAIYSDGMIAFLHRLALDGAQAVLKLTAPLADTERFIRTVADMRRLPEKGARHSAVPLVLSPRQVVKLAFAAMHGASRVNEWETPYFFGYAATPWWRVPGEPGAVINGLFWDAALVDYAAVSHDSALLDERGWDGDYLMRTIGDLETIYFVRDSDDFHVVSWTSAPMGWTSAPDIPQRRWAGGELGKGKAFRASAYSASYNSMQRDLLFISTRVHAGPLNAAWDATEAKALRTMATWLDSPADIERYSRRLPPHRQTLAGLRARACATLPWWRRNEMIYYHLVLPAVTTYLDLPRRIDALRINVSASINSLISRATEIFRRIRLVTRGDIAAREWLRWRFRKAMARVFRRPFDAPRPHV